MSKYRIVEKSFSNGWTGYFIEKSIFGFWCSYTVPTSEYSFGDLSFNRLEDAILWLKEKTKKSPSILRKRVIQ